MSPKYDFDRVRDRRHSDSHKWTEYPADVIPMWLSDMDFPAAPEIIAALHERVEHGFFGYVLPPAELAELFVEYLAKKYQWKIPAEQVVFCPSTHDGFNLTAKAVGSPGDSILMLTPLYPPLLTTPARADKKTITVRFPQNADGRFALDFDALEAAIEKQTRMLLFSNPHNPGGHVFTRDELTRLGEICLRHDLVICSDDIHSGLVYSDETYTPFAAISPEVADRSVILMGPSKTFNLPGLKISLAVIPNPTLRQKIRDQIDRYPYSTLALVAALTAYRECNDWYEELMPYLQANRDYLFQFVQNELPETRMNLPGATYLSWLDCRRLELSEKTSDFFLREAKVALTDGTYFGAGGEGFVRLNFACPRSVLEQALEQIKAALLRRSTMGS